MSSIRLFDRSRTETVLQSASACSDSSELKKLFDRLSDVRQGRIVESQFSIILMLLWDRFSVSKLMQHCRFSIFFRARSWKWKQPAIANFLLFDPCSLPIWSNSRALPEWSYSEEINIVALLSRLAQQFPWIHCIPAISILHWCTLQDFQFSDNLLEIRGFIV